MLSLLYSVRVVAFDAEGIIEDGYSDRVWRLQTGFILLPHFNALIHGLFDVFHASLSVYILFLRHATERRAVFIVAAYQYTIVGSGRFIELFHG